MGEENIGGERGLGIEDKGEGGRNGGEEGGEASVCERDGERGQMGRWEE